jgi:CMP-N,N'-diacetyllegionaminic acid synthase
MNKTFCFDIDGVIATIVEDLKYDKANPINETIELINQLYDIGHRIILFTARGSMTKTNWEDVTEQQMKTWGVKYHELKFGKPAAHYYIDDRMISTLEINEQLKEGKI